MRTTLSVALSPAPARGAGRAGRPAHHAFGAEFDPECADPPAGQGRQARVGQPAHLDSHRGHQAGRHSRRSGWSRAARRTRCCAAASPATPLTVGTEIIVDGYQTKDHSLKRANGRDVTFTDGRKLFMGSSGTGAPRDGSDPTEVTQEARRRQAGRRRLGTAQWPRLREADPAAGGGDGEPQRNRQRADQHLAARCVTNRPLVGATTRSADGAARTRSPAPASPSSPRTPGCNST